jgi:DNA-binding response OmpR family regulator
MSGAARVLVVDDDIEARDTLVHALHERGYRVAATEPAAAGQVAQTFRPDLVVLEMVGEAGVVGDGIARGLRARPLVPPPHVHQ